MLCPFCCEFLSLAESVKPVPSAFLHTSNSRSNIRSEVLSTAFIICHESSGAFVPILYSVNTLGTFLPNGTRLSTSSRTLLICTQSTMICFSYFCRWIDRYSNVCESLHPVACCMSPRGFDEAQFHLLVFLRWAIDSGPKSRIFRKGPNDLNSEMPTDPYVRDGISRPPRSSHVDRVRTSDRHLSGLWSLCGPAYSVCVCGPLERVLERARGSHSPRRTQRQLTQPLYMHPSHPPPEQSLTQRVICVSLFFSNSVRALPASTSRPS